MCGRYNFTGEGAAPQIMEAFRVFAAKGIPVKTGDICPGDVAAVFAANRLRDPAVLPMRWGYRNADGSLLFNARSETAHRKPTFSDGIAHRRCLIPASCYYEWRQTSSGKQKYAISPAGLDTFYLAGIYRIEDKTPAFSILTREPDESVSFIHDRMPVIMPEELFSEWLDPEIDGVELLTEAITTMQTIAC